MKDTEAAILVTKLRAGKRLVTRFQEESWGVKYVGDGRYLKWSRRYEPDGREEESEETMSEEALLAFLKVHFRYEVMAARLVD